MAELWDPFAPGFVRDPYAHYARLRSEDPVHYVETPAVRFFLVTRYDDVVAVLRDPAYSAQKFPERLIADAMAGPDPNFAALARAVSGMMLIKDPPDHTRLRALVSKAFTPAPLPVIVIAELLGVPAADREKFKRWSDEIVPFAAHERDDALSQTELVATAILLLGAGHETTTNLIGNGLLALLRHPRECERLRREPGLVKGAVEELLRFDSPVQLTSRIPRRDVTLRGCRMAAGVEVSLVLGAANRDPLEFPDADRLDLARAENRHVAFGHGPHFCLGAPLARLEAQVAFSRLVERFPSLRATSQEESRRPGLVLRGLAALPVAF